MAEGTGEVGAPVGDHGPDEIRREIEQTRQELGDTVAALAHKTDVKGRAKERVHHARETVSEKRGAVTGKVQEVTPQAAASAVGQVASRARENPVPLAVAGAFAVGFVAGRWSNR